MLWDCSDPFCGAKRLGGLERHCRNCGRPKGDLAREYMPDNVTIANALDGEKKRRAEAGPDFKCKFCDSLQNALNKCCTECGAPQTEGTKAWAAKEESATFDSSSGNKTADVEKNVDIAPIAPSDPFKEDREEYEALHGPIDPPRDTPTKPVTSYRENAADIPIPGFSMARWKKRTFVAVPCVVLTILLAWLIFHTRVVDVKVSSVSWTHKVLIDRYAVWHRDGWVPDPNAFNVHDEGPRIHHYEHVLVGHHTEHYTASEACGQTCRTIPGHCYTTPVHCRSNKNGSATCSGGDTKCTSDRESCSTKYCDVDKTRTVNDYEDQPRYRDYYDWNVWDWGYDRTIEHSGITTAVDWPSDDELKPSHLNDGEQERIGSKQEAHNVTFADVKGRTWDIQPATDTEFQRYPVGSSWRLKVGVAHGVEVLQSKP